MARSYGDRSKQVLKVARIRSHNRRTQVVHWDHNKLLCRGVIDPHHVELDMAVETEELQEAALTRLQQPASREIRSKFVVSLVDIARPAKPRGPAKEFEFIDRVQNVIVLEDSDDDSDDDDWERVSSEDVSNPKRATYSSVLKGITR